MIRIAPEILLSKQGSFKSDVFSFACLAIEVLTGMRWYYHITTRLRSEADVSTRMMIISFFIQLSPKSIKNSMQDRGRFSVPASLLYPSFHHSLVKTQNRPLSYTLIKGGTFPIHYYMELSSMYGFPFFRFSSYPS